MGKNQEQEVRANKLRMLGSQVNLAGYYEDDDTDDTLHSSFHSTDDSQEAAKARASFLMDKHGTLGISMAKKLCVKETIFEDAMITIATPSAPPTRVIKTTLAA